MLYVQTESPYYDNKKEVADITNEKIRKVDQFYGTQTIPSDDILQSKEEADRARFREMMIAGHDSFLRRNGHVGTDNSSDNDRNSNISDGQFTPVLSSPAATESFQPSHGKDDDQLEPELTQRLGNLLQKSVTSVVGSDSDDAAKQTALAIDDQDLKGRYYYDKFQYSPFDAAKHRALRKAYIEGLVWNLKYYYEGCVSWSWFFPYHYGTCVDWKRGADP